MTACVPRGGGSLSSPGRSESPQKLVPSGLTAVHFSPLQGKREDEASDCSPEAEGGGEGSRDRAEEGPHWSDCACGVPLQSRQAGEGGEIQEAWGSVLQSPATRGVGLHPPETAEIVRLQPGILSSEFPHIS